MTGSAALNMLFGAALVALGVLAAALADRIRGLRNSREPRGNTRAPSKRPEPIEVVEAELVQPAPTPVPVPAPKFASKIPSKIDTTMNDVIAALVAAGYKKPIATEAAQGCSPSERATIEIWTSCALRRCARGGQS